MFERRVNTNRLRVGFRANQTRMTIAGVATNAGTRPRVLFVEPNSQWHVKWLESCAFEIVVQMLNALFVAYCRESVRRTGPWLSWILAAVAVYLVKMLGLGVI